MFWGPPGYEGSPPRVLGTPPHPPSGVLGTHGGGSSPSPGFGVPLPPSLSMGGPQNSLGDPKFGGVEGKTPSPPSPPPDFGVSLPPPGLGGPSPPFPPPTPKFCQTNFGSSASNQRNRSRRGRGATKGHCGVTQGHQRDHPGATQRHHRVTVATKGVARAIKGHRGPPRGHRRATGASTGGARRWPWPPRATKGHHRESQGMVSSAMGTARATKGHHWDGLGHHGKSQGTAKATKGPLLR